MDPWWSIGYDDCFEVKQISYEKLTVKLFPVLFTTGTVVLLALWSMYCKLHLPLELYTESFIAVKPVGTDLASTLPSTS